MNKEFLFFIKTLLPTVLSNGVQSPTRVKQLWSGEFTKNLPTTSFLLAPKYTFSYSLSNKREKVGQVVPYKDLVFCPSLFQ